MVSDSGTGLSAGNIVVWEDKLAEGEILVDEEADNVLVGRCTAVEVKGIGSAGAETDSLRVRHMG